MSFHIGAIEGDIADKVLLPGDPLRAKHIANTFLTEVKCYSKVRGMFGFTGMYKGKRVSIQSTGMGMPSAHIYIAELIRDYGCRTMIRVGTYGSISEDKKCGDIILANGASSDSAINEKRFGGSDFAATASFNLLHKAYHMAENLCLVAEVCGVMSQDVFYKEGDLYYDGSTVSFRYLAQFGIKGLDMETCELYSLGAKYNAQVLAIMTCSDEILTGIETTALERETAFDDMVKLALETIVAD